MIMENQKTTEQNIKILKNISIVSGIFAFIICTLIIANFIQFKRVDPLNTKTMNALVEQFNRNPGDEKLKEEIRELDLLARKAFFTNQWQIRTGGLLLLISVVVLIISLKSINALTHKLPVIPETTKDDFFNSTKINRKWIAITGMFIIGSSLLLAFITHNQLSKTLNSDGMNRQTSKNNGLTDDNKTNTSKTATLKDTSKEKGKSEKGSDSVSILLEKAPDYAEIVKNSPSFRGPGSYGIAWQTNVPVSWDGRSGNNVLWKTSVPLPGYNSPIVWKDKVFVAGADANKREVYCFDANTGKILWTTQVINIPGSPSVAPTVSNDTGLSAPTMTTDGRWVFAIFGNGDIEGIDMKGKITWAKNLGTPQNHYGHSSSLLMMGDIVIVQLDQRTGPSVMALSAKTGDLVWKKSRDVKISWASPSLVYTGKRSELILAADPGVQSYNPANGELLWKMDCIFGEVGPSVAYADGIVFAVNEYAKLAAIKIGETPSIIWEDTEYLSDIPSPVATDNYLFLATSYGTVVCYDAKKGTKLWMQEFGNPIFASPILVEGKIYLMDKKGIMHIFRADKIYLPIGSPQLGEGSVCTPAFANGRIYLRGDKNLYCIGK
jgi:outer membrane protein assembly factor BamB